MNFRQLRVVSDAEQWPLQAADLTAQGRLNGDDSTEEIESLIQTGLVMVENHTGLSLAPRQLEMRMDHWPCDEVVLWYPPIRSIEHIKYIDEDGDEQTLDASVYEVDVVGSFYPRIRRAFGQTWPVLKSYSMGRVRITYNAGYAPAGSPGVWSVPKPLLYAARMMAMDLYENRESQITSQYFGERSVIQNPTMKRLLTPYTIGN